MDEGTGVGVEAREFRMGAPAREEDGAMGKI
jgi:hypothetical protein